MPNTTPDQHTADPLELKTERTSSIKRVRSFSLAYAYFTVPFHWRSLKSLLKYLHTVITDFFLLQFLVKWGIKKIPVLPVDNELDYTVPFVPEKVETYLDFINFWITPLSMMVKKLGVKKAVPYCSEFLEYINQSYRDASRVYRFRMTTTNRPSYFINRHFTAIHLLDPHFLCVPSLHVAIVVLTYSYYKKIFDLPDFTDEEREAYNKELYRGALAIIETVLYVKQHSVNCIPAALYMMTQIIGSQFNVEDAVKVIEDLFKSSTDIAEADKIRIHEHIIFLFEQLLLEGCAEDDWVIPVQRWLIKYQPYIGKAFKKPD